MTRAGKLFLEHRPRVFTALQQAQEEKRSPPKLADDADFRWWSSLERAAQGCAFFVLESCGPK
ncbi:hypothetical protein EDC52_102440 [Biostraticola tofi]|uniref:Uncharacterized protein n=1 Tax=Biostraticola tofi TaxID=466109 RepID=A0A4R3Z258_9GAMM|nr:hypothetical protein EDC52_102440 [Biostraticola tofi]